MITILNSKLLIPDISGTIIRERLHFFLEEIPGKKLTTVVIEAGYGKTLLVAQAIGRPGWKTVWCRLGESDQDLVTLLSYLIAGLRRILPDFGEETVSRLKKVRNQKTVPTDHSTKGD